MADKRYVVYVQPAKSNLDSIDGSLESIIRSKCESFLDIWRPEDIFSKPVGGPVKQIKKDRSVVRAFGAHWAGSSERILLVVAVYKKANERDFWAQRDQFQETVGDYLDTLDVLDENEKVGDWISKAKGSDDFLVHESC